MPFVPTQGNPGFSPDVAPQADIQGYQNAAELGGGLGQAMEQTGDMLSQHALYTQGLINDAAATQMDTHASSQVDLALMGLKSKQGADALNAFGPNGSTFSGQLDTIHADAVANLNPMQQKMFDQKWSRLYQYGFGAAASHVGQENRTYLMTTQDAAMTQASNSAALNSADDTSFAMGQQSVQQAAQSKAQAAGLSGNADVINSMAQKGIDDAWQSRIETMAPMDAQAALDKLQAAERGDLTATLPDGTKTVIHPPSGPAASRLYNFLQAKIGEQYPETLASTVTGHVLAGMQSDGPHNSGGSLSWRNQNPGNIRYGDFAMAHGAVGQSGGFAVFPDYATGRAATESLLSSPSYSGLTLAGAINKWAPPSENDTNSYVGAVAKQTGLDPNTKLADMTTDQRSVLADAIQQHEGWVPGKGAPPRPAITAVSGPDGSSVAVPSVPQVIDGTTPQGTPPPTKGQVLRQNYSAMVDQITAATADAAPGVQQRALSALDRQVQIQETAERSQFMGDSNAVNKALFQPNGAAGPTSWAQLRSDPQTSAALDRALQYDPSVTDKINSALKMNARGVTNTPNAANASRFQSVLGISYNDPDKFNTMDMGSLMVPGVDASGTPTEPLTYDQAHQLIDRQAAMMSQQGRSDARMGTVNSVLNNGLVRAQYMAAGLNPNAKDEAGKQNWESFVGALDAEIKQREDQNGGKALNPADIPSLTANLLATVHIHHTGMLWNSTEDKPAYQVPGIGTQTPYGEGEGQVTVDIPPADRSGLTVALTKRLGRAPTESELSATFYHMKSGQ